VYLSKLDEEDSCFDGCSDTGEKCLCEPGVSSLFDVSGQVERIFTNSNLALLTDRSAFEGWELYNNGVFWIVVSGLILTIGTGVVVVKVLPQYCMIDKLV